MSSALLILGTSAPSPLLTTALDAAGVVWSVEPDELNDPVVVIFQESPHTAARRSFERDGASVMRGGVIWARHLLDAEQRSRGRQRAFVLEAELLQDPAAVLQTVGALVGTDLPTPTGNGVEAPADTLADDAWGPLADVITALGSVADRSPDELADLDARLDDLVAGAADQFADLDRTTARSLHTMRRAGEHQRWLTQLEDQQRSQAEELLRLDRALTKLDKKKKRPLAERAVRKVQRAPKAVRRRASIQRRKLQALRSGQQSGDTPDLLVQPSAVPHGALSAVPQPSEQVDVPDAEHLGRLDGPVVSVIVPVYNEIRLTEKCVQTVRDNPPSVPYEIVLVDDCSTDPEVVRLADLDGVRLFTNESNLGFVGTCNRGAAEANGAYLFFLNSDTEMTEGALDAMLSTFRLFPGTGAVGAKLLFPNGKVQEAGGIVWQDASAWNYGRDRHPADPELNYARAVDYVSGAALMLPAALFDHYGGFDDHYSPAYYEDADLCMKLNQGGWPVIYQPAAVVYHREGASYGTDVVNDTGKHNQVINRDRFLGRWRDELLHHRPNGAQPEQEKERRITKRALVIDARVITADQDAGSLRMSNLFAILQREGYKVTFVPQNLLFHQPYVRQLQARGIEVHTRPFLDDVEQFLHDRGTEFDLVILSRLEVAERQLDAVRMWCPTATVIYDTVDLHFLREEREMEVRGEITTGGDHEATRRSELSAIRRSDITFVCSTVEADLLTELVPDTEVKVVSLIHDEQPSRAPADARHDLLFVGGFEHPPNIDGATWMATEIMPLVVRTHPDVHLHIVGSKMPPEIHELAGPNVIVHGFVEDLDPLYEEARICLAPLRFGAGVKGKITQAMVRGVPTVATTLAMEGIPTGDGEAVLVADTPEDIAAAVARLLDDDNLWAALTAEGQRVVAEHFSIEALTEHVRQALPR
ncbi:MAG: glycosyltransferase [Acidimicrobiales bacterium]